MQTKEQKDWTEDEKRLAGEYEQKVKDLNEEREKYRKVHLILILLNISMAIKLILYIL